MAVPNSVRSTGSESTLQRLQELVFECCRSTLSFHTDLSVEGLLGITLDKEKVVLVSIRESFCRDASENQNTRVLDASVELPARTGSSRKSWRRISPRTKVVESGTFSQESSVPAPHVADANLGSPEDDVLPSHRQQDFPTNSQLEAQPFCVNTENLSQSHDPSDVSLSRNIPVAVESTNVLYIVTQSASDQVRLELAEGVEVKHEGELIVKDQDATGNSQQAEEGGEKAENAASVSSHNGQQAVERKDFRTLWSTRTDEMEKATTSDKGDVNLKDGNVAASIAFDRLAKKHECLQCGKLFSRKNHLTNHLKVHRDCKPGCSCNTCGRVFASHSQLQKHSGTHSMTRSRHLACEHCGKAFFWERDRTRHLKRHTRSPNFLCGVCGKAFYEDNRLQRHLRTHGVGQLVCDQCGKGFRDAHSLKLHLDAHKGMYPYQCNLCRQGFLEKRRLVGHMNSHKRSRCKEHLCQICQKGFTHSKSLVFHLKTKH